MALRIVPLDSVEIEDASVIQVVDCSEDGDVLEYRTVSIQRLWTILDRAGVR